MGKIEIDAELWNESRQLALLFLAFHHPARHINQEARGFVVSQKRV
jgi:hypothetical protein